LHKKLKIEQHESTKKNRGSHGLITEGIIRHWIGGRLQRRPLLYIYQDLNRSNLEKKNKI